MPSTFLHEDKKIPHDEMVDVDRPTCEKCREPMWLTKVETQVLPTKRLSKRDYECVACGAAKTVQRSDAM
jgi:RNase P subunit RPR2